MIKQTSKLCLFNYALVSMRALLFGDFGSRCTLYVVCSILSVSSTHYIHENAAQLKEYDESLVVFTCGCTSFYAEAYVTTLLLGMFRELFLTGFFFVWLAS